jgi:hypothetical protein
MRTFRLGQQRTLTGTHSQPAISASCFEKIALVIEDSRTLPQMSHLTDWLVAFAGTQGHRTVLPHIPNQDQNRNSFAVSSSIDLEIC